MNLGAVDRQYAAIENNPFADGEIILRLVIQGTWYRLIFNFDNKRFTEGKVTLPVIKVEDGTPVFIFTVVTDNPVVQFSGDYTIGVDVGINNYATVVVREVKTGRIVYETTLSQRVHSLWNSVRASEAQSATCAGRPRRCFMIGRRAWRRWMRRSSTARRHPARNAN